MPSTELELLAPARDAGIGIEAINHGADAVYIGGPGFGARDKAANSVADIERLARHAHRFHARVFVTLNTILRDDELEDARRLAWQLHAAGVDALIVQDMGLLMLDLPPIQLHASTQTDIRTPEKARFLQDVGFSQMVLARELTLPQIQAVASQVTQAKLEFFVHGALCVAYSGQCFISHAINGRSANRGNCSQECRQPYTVTDAKGAIVAHERHVLSLKDNDQTANLAALVQAGIRSFKIEGRYKDMATVKNVTAHFRQQLDRLMEGRSEMRASSSGRVRHFFTPDPQRGFNRGSTDYFVNGRQIDIGAFDTPKHAGMPLGHVLRVGADHFDLRTDDPQAQVHNGDALTWWDLQGELQGIPVNVAQPLGDGLWRIEPNLPAHARLPGSKLSQVLKDLRRDTPVSRNRDMAWERLLDKPSAQRCIGVQLVWSATSDGFALAATDDDGHHVSVESRHPHEPAQNPDAAQASLEAGLRKWGGTVFEVLAVQVAPAARGWFVPASVANAMRREAAARLEAARAAAFERLPRAQPVTPPVPYPQEHLTYLANVFNRPSAAFYARHGVKIIDAAYESHERLDEVPLMITKHCVRFSLSLCPKQAKGVVGVQGTVRAEPMTLTQGAQRFRLVFDCKPCEMHVMGQMRTQVLRDAALQPLTFYRTRPPRLPRSAPAG
jgi:putative protease